MRDKETISFYKDTALMSKGGSPHIDEEYDILADEIEDDGVRIIKLKPKDKSEQISKIVQIVEALLKKLGEEDSRLLHKLLLDAMRDYDDKTVERLYKKVVLGVAPVKTRPGCFKIIIGDGRRKNCEVIRLLESW